jgi:transposase InsO family protein
MLLQIGIYAGGFPKCFHRIRKLGYQWNHKRVYRAYCELKLNLRVKRKKRIPPRCPERLLLPNKQGECWSMDFMSDSSCNYRTEVLDLYLFNNLEQVRKITEEWLTIYNTERPHEALNNMTPIEYKTLKQAA